MRLIPFYISSHGFGHMTRSLAIIEELLEEPDTEIYIVCGAAQIDFATLYLAKFGKRISYHSCVTDIGLINISGTLDVDKNALITSLEKYIVSFESLVLTELDFLQDKELSLILTDISPLGVEVAKRLGVKSIGISNFTWFEQYKQLDLPKKIVDFFKEKYAAMNEFYVLGLATEEAKSRATKEFGFVSRTIDKLKARDLATLYNTPVFISFGKSTNMKEIYVDYEGVIITTKGTHVKTNGRLVELHESTLDTQNFISACKLVITKIGWGTISESLISGVPFVLIAPDDSCEEDSQYKELKNNNLCLCIKEDSLSTINITQLRAESTKLHMGSFHNSNEDIAKAILA